MYYTYILQSQKTDRYYVGHTCDLAKRLHRHNAGYVMSTKSRRPWILVHKEKFHSKKQAYRREMQIKSFKSGDAFRALFENMPT